MASSEVPHYTCRCLNIRLFRRQPEQEPPRTGTEDDYLPLYIGEDGITVAHNELTLRARSIRAVPDAEAPSGTRSMQRTSVTCLVCGCLSYRVEIEVEHGTEAIVGPVLPTEDWVERDTLSSKSGWVEVHAGKEGCLNREAALRLLSSQAYSTHFAIALPNSLQTIASSPPSTFQNRLLIPPSHAFLPTLPLFLPPPPFTPSHPIFLHLAAVATASSNIARSVAEKQIESFTKQQVEQLEIKEAEMKTQLELLWRGVREELKRVEKERDSSLLTSSRARRSTSPGGRSSSLSMSSSIIRDFVPTTYHTTRISRPSIPRQSALSASLATSSFHHPRARAEETHSQTIPTIEPAHTPLSNQSPPPYVSNPPSPGNSSSLSSSDPPTRAIPLSLKRNMDESIDAAVTYKWSVIEEQEAARRKAMQDAERDKEKTSKPVESQTQAILGAGEGIEQTSNIVNSEASAGAPTSGLTEVTTDLSERSAVSGDKKGHVKRKHARKVTFDVKPAVVTIKRNITAEEEGPQLVENGDDLIFNIDENDEREEPDDALPRNGKTAKKPSLSFRPVVESHHREESVPASYTVSNKDHGMRALYNSPFSSFLSASLPAQTAVRPPTRSSISGGVSERPALSSSLLTQDRKGKSKAQNSEPERRLLPHRAELLKLVAAESPSHRGAWDKDSEAWKIFDGTGGQSPSSEEDDDESEEDSHTDTANGIKISQVAPKGGQPEIPGFARSLPIPMTPVSKQLAANGPSSLQRKTSLTDRPGVLVPPLSTIVEEGSSSKRSSSANRRRVYAQRDRKRARDPGIMDFTENQDGDDDDAESQESDSEIKRMSTSRGRQHALRILRAGSSVPAAGLWRSLAN